MRILKRLDMRPENLSDKLDLEIQWLASHADQAHPISGITMVRRVINGRARTFYGEAKILFLNIRTAVFRAFSTYQRYVIIFFSVFRPSRQDHAYCLRVPKPNDPPQGPNPPNGVLSLT